MSWEATAYVKELRAAPGTGEALTRSEKLVLFVLADFHNTQERAAWPSAATIATAALLTERHVWRLLRALAGKGALVCERRADARGGRATNCYRFVGLDTDPTGHPGQEECDAPVRGEVSSPSSSRRAPRQEGSDAPVRGEVTRPSSPRCPPGQSGSDTPVREAVTHGSEKPPGEPPEEPPAQPSAEPPSQPPAVLLRLWRTEMGETPTPAQLRRLVAWSAQAMAQGRPALVAETVQMAAERGKGWGYFAAAMVGRLEEGPRGNGEQQQEDEEASVARRTLDIARQLRSDDLPLCRRAAEGDRAALRELRRRFFGA